ncbi:MAG: hypothetical protein R3F59_28350 [Myxococcota bacterium]
MVVADVAAHPDGAVLVVLSAAARTCCCPATAPWKCDEFAGEPHHRWIFLYGGQILVAG